MNEAIISVYNLNNYTKTFVVLLDTWVVSRIPDSGSRIPERRSSAGLRTARSIVEGSAVY
jgi:hypothetical protein